MNDEVLSEAGVREAWTKTGWPRDVLDRALSLHLPRRAIADRIAMGEQGLERLQWIVPQAEDLTFGAIRGRELTYDDNDRLSELWANAPETVGNWEITVERSPNAFAQFGLQENVSFPVLEEGGRLLACVVWAKRNLVVQGMRVTVHCGQGLRVHRDWRGRNFGNLVRAVSQPPWHPPTTGQYHYVRSQNFGAINFFRHTSPRVVDSSPDREGDVPGIPVTVLQFPAQEFTGDASAIRKAMPDDVAGCAVLINRTHGGLDLFRPYAREELSLRLDEGYWGSRAPWTPHVYGWEDFYVVEDGGEVVACGGLWDRGRDMRERWRNKATGEERSMSVTALLDFGFAAGREDAMAGLIGHFIGETSRLGRDVLLAPLQFLPEVAALLEDYEPREDTRGLGWLMWDAESEKLGHPVVMPERPYTDLAYW
jgi:hypothetical protein